MVDKIFKFSGFAIEFVMILVVTVLSVAFILLSEAYTLFALVLFGMIDVCLVYECFYLWKMFFKHIKNERRVHT